MPTVHPVATPPAPGDPSRPAVGAATALLDAYRPGDHFLSTPTRTLLADGVRASVAPGDAPLTERVRAALADAAHDGDLWPMILGAVPFDPDEPAALVVPERGGGGPPRRTHPLVALVAGPAAPPPREGGGGPDP
ncbi:isochorismate synthase, partial [Streptomyces goshikiensis]